MRSGIALALLFALSPCPALADPAQVAPLAPTGSVGATRLGVGDKITVRFADKPEMSGDYKVQEDGQLSIPLLGPIEATGKTVREFADAMSLTYERVFRAPPAATVDVSEWRPISVIGTVENPGVYPFKPQMTVMQAFATAGGLYRPANFASLLIESLREKQEYNTALARLKQALARKIRIETEINDSPDIIAPARLTELADVAELKALLAGEQRILANNRKALDTKSQGFDEIITLSEREIEELDSQLLKVKEQLKLLDKELAVTENLSSRGLTVRTQTLERQLQIASVQATEANIVSQRLRAQQGKQTAIRDRELLKPESRSKLDEELKLVDADIKNQEIIVASALVAINRIAEIEQNAETTDGSAKLSYQLTRTSADGFRTINVKDTYVLEPGDVVKVVLLK